jgi:hypothetical protein
VIRIQDIHSLTDFHRHSKAYVRRLKRTGRPEMLTVNGAAELVVQSAVAYERLVHQLERCRARVGRGGSAMSPLPQQTG